MKKPPALWALAAGAFSIGMTEFVTIGLLEQVATEFNVSPTIAGWAVTSYALGVMLGSPFLTWLGLKLDRKYMLALLIGIFALGNAVTALAPIFGIVILGRIITSFAHGVFFGMGSVVGAELVGPERQAGAVAFMFSGLTLANLVGVPIGSWVGIHLGWRLTFGAISLLGLAVFAMILLFVPKLPHTTTPSIRRELRAVRDPQVILALLMTLLGFGGVFAAITYLAPIATGVTGLPHSAVTYLMIILGLGMVIGNYLGGKLADRNLMPSVLTSLALLAAALLAFSLSLHNVIALGITLFLIGAIGFATVPPLQTVTLRRASHAPTLASVLNIGSFNMGNAVAAWLGGLAILTPAGYQGTGLVGVAMSVTALALAVVSIYLDRREQRVVRDINAAEALEASA